MFSLGVRCEVKLEAGLAAMSGGKSAGEGLVLPTTNSSHASELLYVKAGNVIFIEHLSCATFQSPLSHKHTHLIFIMI